MTATNGSAIDEKRSRAVADLADRDGVLIAFSGGVDSSVVAAMAQEALGAEAVACTARSETLPEAELADARAVADEIGIRHVETTVSELDDPDFRANDERRCYHCRSMRLDAMARVADREGLAVVCDGTTADDGDGHRPGLEAVAERETYSPLRAHDITKSEARSIARHYDLSVADKPSMACLSSRIPTGERITADRLTRVERAEALLRSWGFEQFRVRDHGDLARIEVGADELDAALDPDFAAAAREHVGALGFEHVTLDLAGYRTGSVSPE
ncbi:MAG: ATP-dependent sacrificial sulfur transferase LarE [Halococcoides sp.]